MFPSSTDPDTRNALRPSSLGGPTIDSPAVSRSSSISSVLGEGHSSPMGSWGHPTPPASPSVASLVRNTAVQDQATHEDRLTNRGDYLPNPEVVNLLKWTPDETASNGDILKWMDTGEVALLSTIGQVTPERVKLGVLGNWEAKYGKPISEAKLQFTLGGVVDSPVLNEAHTKAISVLRQIQQMGARTQTHNHLLREHRGRDCVRLSMPIFVPRSEVYEPQGRDRADPTRTYPVPAAVRPDLEEILEHFRLNDMRIYDVDGTPIPPTVMSTRLVGATVEVWFTIQHFVFGNQAERATDTFTAKLFQLRVLRRPSTGASSPFAGRSVAQGPYVPPSSPSRFGARSGTGTPTLMRTASGGSATGYPFPPLSSATPIPALTGGTTPRTGAAVETVEDGGPAPSLAAPASTHAVSTTGSSAQAITTLDVPPPAAPPSVQTLPTTGRGAAPPSIESPSTTGSNPQPMVTPGAPTGTAGMPPTVTAPPAHSSSNSVAAEGDGTSTTPAASGGLAPAFELTTSSAVSEGKRRAEDEGAPRVTARRSAGGTGTGTKRARLTGEGLDK